jgi:hypothetical protein
LTPFWQDIPPYILREGGVMKTKFLLLAVVAGTGLLAQAAFKNRFHNYLASRGIIMSA